MNTKQQPEAMRLVSKRRKDIAAWAVENFKTWPKPHEITDADPEEIGCELVVLNQHQLPVLRCKLGGGYVDSTTWFYAKKRAAARDVERWIGIGKAIERACMDLPDGTEISVSLEKDAGTVTLIDRDGNEHENFSCDYGFAGVLNEAIDAALAAQAKQGDAA